MLAYGHGNSHMQSSLAVQTVTQHGLHCTLHDSAILVVFIIYGW